VQDVSMAWHVAPTQLITDLVRVFGCRMLTSSGLLWKPLVKPESCSDRVVIFGNGSFPWMKEMEQHSNIFCLC